MCQMNNACCNVARLLTDSGMRLHLALLLLQFVTGQYPSIRDCSILKPTQCQGIPLEFANGTFSFTEYQLSCQTMVCSNPAPDASWFCGSDVLNYPAQVTTNSSLAPGKAEDNWAACLYNNWRFALLQDNCRDVQLWTCDDCRAAYRSWLCSQIFQRCANGDPLQRIPVCRNICFNVVQKCPATQQFDCPLMDPRDYSDSSGL